jgi:hypothetical protein
MSEMLNISYKCKPDVVPHLRFERSFSVAVLAKPLMKLPHRLPQLLPGSDSQ